MIRKFIFNNSAYIISYLSITGYFLAYKYKEGYFKYFNIPSVYIDSVDFIDIITMISAIVAFLSFATYILINPRSKKDNKNTWKDRIDKNSISLVLLLTIAGYFDIPVIRGMALVITFLILFYNLVFPLFYCKEVKGYNNKVMVFFNDKEPLEFTEVIEHKIKHQLFTFILVIVIVTYAFGSFMHLLGQENAKKTTTFDVTKIEGEKYILFNVINNQVIAARLNNSNELSNSYTMFSKSEILIWNEEIQDLKVK